VRRGRAMSEMIGFCGLGCHECGAFLATISDDYVKRKEVAELWSKEYSVDLKPEDIICDGCLSESENLFRHCKVCEIRKCGKEKAVGNCAHCSDYACTMLEKFLKMVPDARTRLDAIRGGN
jgi:hypothetical protein